MGTNRLKNKIGVMKQFVVANFKMNGSMALIQDYMINVQSSDQVTVIVCPPACYIPLLHWSAKFSLGAQNCHHLEIGAHTGEISPRQLKDVGCEYVIVGHSERRLQFQETNEMINQKAVRAIACGLTPIICIGETYAERQEDRFQRVLLSQIDQSTHGLNPYKYILAYEPIWSIGTGLAPTAEDIQTVLRLIHKRLGSDVPIIYGGSVTDKNAGVLTTIPYLRGVLVGGASLNLQSFQHIVYTFQGG
jgi:triosephosphate isomerase